MKDKTPYSCLNDSGAHARNGDRQAYTLTSRNSALNDDAGKSHYEMGAEPRLSSGLTPAASATESTRSFYTLAVTACVIKTRAPSKSGPKQSVNFAEALKNQNS
jgi:hypothetical protein